MTTQQTPTIDRLLIDKRDGGTKAEAIRAIGCSRPMYDAWEGFVYIPGDEWAVPLSVYLGYSEKEMAWILYQSRLTKARLRPELASPLSLDLGQAVSPRYVKLDVGVDRPIDNRPPSITLPELAA